MRGQQQRRCTILAIAVAVATTLAACTDEPESSDEGVAGDPSTGGEVHIYSTSTGFSHLDPQRIYVTDGSNVSRLINRTLTTYAAEPGVAGAELVGDLATDTGKPNSDHSVWDFTLREGVKWETGEEVTCDDIRYGVLRNFDALRDEDEAVLVNGSPWAREFLDMAEGYRGPKGEEADPGDGVECVDDDTIRFRLKESTPDFAYAVSMPAFAPVQEKSDTWEDYDLKPLSNGPYKLTSYEPAPDGGAGTAVFERNPHWDSETDEVRRAAPDRIVFTFGADREEVTQQIVEGNPEYDNAVLWSSLPPNYLQQVVGDPELSRQVVEGDTQTIRYLAINTETVPQVECRQALVYAFDKAKYREAYGGSAIGDFATTMIGPDDPGHKDFDVYDLADQPDGDFAAAQQLMQDADCPDRLVLDVPDDPLALRLAETIQESYGRIGVAVEFNLISDPSKFYDVVGNPDSQNDLVMAGWVPDWPGGSSVIKPLFDGDAIHSNGNFNFSQLQDEHVDELIDAASAAPAEEAPKLWGELDQEIQQLAATVPILYQKVTVLCGPNVRGAFVNPQWAMVELLGLGLDDPDK